MAAPPASLSDRLRAWRRRIKARLPYVRRREHRLLSRRYAELIESMGWTAPLATEAGLQVMKPVAEVLRGDMCFFVSHAAQPRLKRHVLLHVEHLLQAGVNVVLILNTDLAPAQIDISPELLDRLGGVYVRDNVGFDFAAWAHVFCLLHDRSRQWSRLFLVNDSIVGPLDLNDFDMLMRKVRQSNADVIGLTENRTPVPHVQSFFLVLAASALAHPAVTRAFRRMFSLPSKGQVIDVYEARLTKMLAEQGLRFETVFEPLSSDPSSSDDTMQRWEELIRAGFPFIKYSILSLPAASEKVRALVPPELLPSDD